MIALTLGFVAIAKPFRTAVKQPLLLTRY
jgi:hypothetical protein